MTLPGLRKQLALATIQVLNAAFNATTNPDGTVTGQWTDDGGFARTVTIRGAWTIEPAAYPLIDVWAERGAYTPPTGNVLKSTTVTPGQLAGPVLGGVIEDSAIHCKIKSFNWDEREQLADLVDQLLDCELNAAGVPFRAMLQNRGVTLKQSRPDRVGVDRQDADPAHGPVVPYVDLVYLARSQIVYVPTLTALNVVTVKATLNAPSFNVTTASSASPSRP